MLFPTHILLGIVMFLIFKDYVQGANETVFFLVVLLGSILPDIDEKNSTINKWLGILGKGVALFFSHRGIFHSLPLFIVFALIVKYFFNGYYAIGLLVGYLAHLIGDGVTKMGVMVFYPFSRAKIRGPIRVGGSFEKIIMVVLIVLILRELFL